MANQIIPKKSVVAGKVPTAGDLGLGEVSINHADRVIFSRHPQSGTVQQIGAAPVHTHVLTDITDLNTLVLDADWNDILNKPATFPPSSHTHPLSDLTQSSASSGQVPTWSGTAWVPQTPPAGTNADWSATSGAAQILNKPTLATVATSGSYTDLSNKPTLGTAASANSSDFATAAQGAKADTASQPGHTHTASEVSGLAAVATSGSYADLSNKPTIPAAQVNSDWNATSGAAQILNKPTLGTAAATNSTAYATAAQGAKADSASQPGHTHALSDLTQSSATSGQVPTWSGTAWVAQTPVAAPVQSVAGKNGAVILSKSDVGLSNVDNTSDANKPISDAAQTALNLKVNTSSLGTAAYQATSAFATSAQGVKADSASQPGHLHALSDLTQSSATSGQVPTWSGTAWVAQTPAAGGSSIMQAIAVNMILS